MANRGQPLLDGRRGQRLRLPLDPGGHVQRLHRGDRRHAATGAPGEKLADRVRVRAACVRVANR